MLCDRLVLPRTLGVILSHPKPDKPHVAAMLHVTALMNPSVGAAGLDHAIGCRCNCRLLRSDSIRQYWQTCC